MADELDGEKKGGAKKGLGAKKAPAKKASSAKKLAGAKKLGGGAKKAAKKATSSPRAAGRPSHDEIATAAYHRWERDGGSAEQNWLDAERELRGDS